MTTEGAWADEEGAHWASQNDLLSRLVWYTAIGKTEFGEVREAKRI